MSTHPSIRSAPSARKALVPNAVLAVLIFIMTEAMLFAGLISAFVIAEAGAAPGTWPPPTQARLPVAETLINTIALLTSGVLIVLVNKHFVRRRGNAMRIWAATLALGAFFLAFQGYEWVGLIANGLTPHTSNHGAFFYLIVGMHGLHVLAGLCAIGGLYFRARKVDVDPNNLKAASIYWLFVVGLWPPLYWLVYL